MLEKYNLDIIKTNVEKTYIIDILYNNINFYNIKYQLINTLESLHELKKIIHNDTCDINKYTSSLTYYVIPHIIGISSILLIDPKLSYPIIIIKKNLKYYRNQVDVNNVVMYKLINYKKVYDKLTIIDGKFSNTLDDNKKIYFHIHDIYIYQNKKLYTEQLLNKYNLVNELDLFNSSTIIFDYPTLYKIDQLPLLIYDKIKDYNFKINGLIFVPERTGKTYIYINDQEFADLKNNNIYASYLKNYEYLKVPNIPLNIYNDCNLFVDPNKTKIFIIKKTKISDVYELYNFDNDQKINNSNLYIYINNSNYEDIAHIPDIKTSHYIKDLLNNVGFTKINCIFSPKFNKWIPKINL